MTITSIQDRTPEFFSILAQAKKKQNNTKGPRSSLLSDAQKREANGSASGERRARSEFARNAAQVGRGISATMGKLEKLAQCTHTSRLWSLQMGLFADFVSGKAKDPL
jgi:syntaxin 5